MTIGDCTYGVAALEQVLPDCGKLLKSPGEGSCFFARRDTPRWIVANSLGAEVLSLCNGRRSLHQIAKLIHKRYNCSLAEARRDVLSFWSEIEASQFLAEPSPPSKQPSERALEFPQLYVTTRCNQSCPHCAVRGAFPEEDMPAELFLDVVRQSAALGASRVVITGGEPFVRDDLLGLIAAAAGSLPVKLLTNGTLLGKREARELARLGVEVQVSLDGGTREVHDAIRGKGAFEAAVESIRMLRDFGVTELSVNFTIQRANASDVSALLHLAEREGVRKVSLMPLIPGAEGDRRFQCADSDSMLTAKRQADAYDGPVAAEVLVSGIGRDALSGQPWCVPGRSPAVGPDGSVYPCAGLVRTPFLAGKLPQETLEEALRRKSLEDLRRVCQERVDTISECASCVWKHFCRSGCPAFAYHQQGTLLAKDCFCEIRKRLYSDLFLGGQDDAGGFTE